MSKKKINPIVLFIEKYLAAVLVYIFGITWKFQKNKDFKSDEVIYTFWHRNLLPLMYLHKNQGAVILVSKSNDGALIAAPAEVLGYKTVRGSSSRGGSSALKSLIRQSKNNSLAITPDGPKGPIYELKDGVMTLALLTKKPIIPIAVNIDREKVFDSWDRFRFPKLFSKISVKYGDPIYVKSKEDLETQKGRLIEALGK